MRKCARISEWRILPPTSVTKNDEQSNKKTIKNTTMLAKQETAGKINENEYARA